MRSFNKKILRKEILYKRDNIENKEKINMDRIIANKLYESEYYKEASKIFIYVSFGAEINTKIIINKALNDGKKIYIPRSDYKTKLMEAVQIKSLNELIEDSYGILSPNSENEPIDPNELDLIIMPGVAFDKNGGRMGYGAGFYDRYLKRIAKANHKRIPKVALAYDVQIVERVPMYKEDMPIDYILSEKENIICTTEI